MNADDRELIERTRKINKTLSMYVFALQEGAEISSDSQLGIADMLVALADTIRSRASESAAESRDSAAQPAAEHDARLLIEGTVVRPQLKAPNAPTGTEQPGEVPHVDRFS